MIIPALKKTYKDQVVLDTCEIEIPDGSIVAICGQNGSGKSTFAKILAGIIKDDDTNASFISGYGTPSENSPHSKTGSYDAPSENSSRSNISGHGTPSENCDRSYISSHGTPSENCDDSHAGSHGNASEGCARSKLLSIGYMTQTSYAFNLSVKNNILLNSDKSKSKSENISRAHMLMSAMNMELLCTKNAQKLSGGETQRMSLCRLLMKKYDIIILDEPTSAMDKASVPLAEGLILDYHKETGCTVMLITHDSDQALRLSDMTLTFVNGSITGDGFMP